MGRMSNAMNLSRREFASVMAAALAAGFPLREAGAAQAASLYELPRTGNVHLLHMTDCHAQLLPIYFREPSDLPPRAQDIANQRTHFSRNVFPCSAAKHTPSAAKAAAFVP